MNPKANFYFEKEQKWSAEIAKLREIVLSCGLVEEVKWGCPCYMHQKGNIVLIHVFKEYCALLLFKGSLLKDEKGILVQQTTNVQAGRQIRFTQLSEILQLEPILKAYLFEAIELEKSGKKVELKKSEEYQIPEEFIVKLKSSTALKSAFEALTPGRQRGYYLFFAAPKQAKTRESRIEKCIPLIMEGKGLND